MCIYIVDLISPWGFIYLTTNMVNGKKYIGQKIFKNDWKSYLGSGKLILRAIEKNGKENFSREIIAIAYSKDELNQLEIEFIKNHDAVEDKDYYNIGYGGGSPSGLRHSTEAKNKMSVAKKGIKLSDKHKQSMRIKKQEKSKVKIINKDVYEKEMFYTYYPTSICKDFKLTNKEFVVLMLLYTTYMPERKYAFSSIYLIQEYTKMDSDYNRIFCAIQGLIEKKYIINLTDINHNNIVIDNITNKYKTFHAYLLLNPFNDEYFKVNNKNIIKLFNYLENKDFSKFNIVRYYFSCMAVSYNDNNFGYFTQKELKLLVTDVNTIRRYNEILQNQLNLVDIQK